MNFNLKGFWLWFVLIVGWALYPFFWVYEKLHGEDR